MLIALLALSLVALVASELDRHYGTDLRVALFTAAPQIFGIGFLIWEVCHYVF